MMMMMMMMMLMMLMMPDVSLWCVADDQVPC
jgi:hypothetical protein